MNVHIDAEKAAENPILKMWSRFSMVVMIPVMGLIVGLVSYNVNTIVNGLNSRSDALSARLNEMNNTILKVAEVNQAFNEAIDVRVARIETTFAMRVAISDKLRADSDAAILRLNNEMTTHYASMEDKLEKRLEVINGRLDDINKLLAVLSVREGGVLQNIIPPQDRFKGQQQ